MVIVEELKYVHRLFFDNIQCSLFVLRNSITSLCARNRSQLAIRHSITEERLERFAG